VRLARGAAAIFVPAIGRPLSFCVLLDFRWVVCALVVV
jgi:hypothetical protein